MSSLKLSNPFRRRTDRSSLKDRVADLRTTANCAMSRTTPDTSAGGSEAETNLPGSSNPLASVPLDSLFALADIYWNAARCFHVGAFWPKLQAGEGRPGSNIATHEGGRLSERFAETVAEMARREPRDDSEAEQRREWKVRLALDRGDERAAVLILMGSPCLCESDKAGA